MKQSHWDATIQSMWGYSALATGFMAPYPHFYLFPTRIVARRSRLPGPPAAKEMPADVALAHATPFFANITPIEGFLIWLIEQLFRLLLVELWPASLPLYTCKFVMTILCAPIKLVWTRSIVRDSRASVKQQIKSLRSIKFTWWLQYIVVLLVCDSLELFSKTIAGRIFGTVWIPTRKGRMSEDLTPAEITALKMYSTHYMIMLASFIPMAVFSVRSALAIPYPGQEAFYGGGNGLWNDIWSWLRSIDLALCWELTRTTCVGCLVMMATFGLEFVGFSFWHSIVT
ncbi:hypothetical protein FALBO_6756 [Fusarium albosuccineum]|uniref:Uncharacterized protein n=1 Tax=Fusarium albosuccineum TaxID=1237068 RepID=A0A8H4LCP9_9HYPO|nr:hypothetical protein FALBO_6756 [Fusarium albosuccineum]